MKGQLATDRSTIRSRSRKKGGFYPKHFFMRAAPNLAKKKNAKSYDRSTNNQKGISLQSTSRLHNVNISTLIKGGVHNLTVEMMNSERDITNVKINATKHRKNETVDFIGTSNIFNADQPQIFINSDE